MEKRQGAYTDLLNRQPGDERRPLSSRAGTSRTLRVDWLPEPTTNPSQAGSGAVPILGTVKGGFIADRCMGRSRAGRFRGIQ